MRRLVTGSAIAFVAMVVAPEARAEEPSAGKKALGVGAAVVPGVLVHGSGACVVGKQVTARKLAIVGGVSLVGTATAVALIALTGASRRVVGPLAAASVLGVGVFSTSLLADLYAVLAPEGGTGVPLREAAPVETMIGAYAVSDPVFRHSGIVMERVDLRWASLRTSLQVEHAPGTVSRRLRVEEAVRLHGPTPSRGSREQARARDGSFVDVEAALTDHAYPRDGFGTTIAEVAVRGRLDLVRFDGELRGAFVEGQLGGGLMVDRFRAVGGNDTNSILLSRFAFGTYLGVPSASASSVSGEAMVFYDHRRDGYVGGLQPNGIGAGYLGSVGAATRLWLGSSWGVGANVQVGSALVGGASLHFRSGVL